MIGLGWLNDLAASTLPDREAQLFTHSPDAGFWLRLGAVLIIAIVIISLAQAWKVVLNNFELQEGKFTTHHVVAYIIAISAMTLVFHFVGPFIFGSL